jgi:hypothetical protein
VKELTSTPERRKAQRREYQAKLKAMTAQCPVCDAPPGDPCWREGDKTVLRGYPEGGCIVTALVVGIALIAIAVAVLSWVLRQAKDGRRG